MSVGSVLAVPSAVAELAGFCPILGANPPLLADLTIKAAGFSDWQPEVLHILHCFLSA